mgnify:CR=1 FL=1
MINKKKTGLCLALAATLIASSALCGCQQSDSSTSAKFNSDVADDAHALALLRQHIAIGSEQRDGAADRHARAVKLLRELGLRRQIALIRVCAVVDRLLHGVIDSLKDGSRHGGLLDVYARAADGVTRA